jgi:hypothetical protein
MKGTARAKNVINCVVFVMPLLFILMRMHNNQKTVAAILDVHISLFRLNKPTMMHETFSSKEPVIGLYHEQRLQVSIFAMRAVCFANFAFLD